MPEQEEDPPIRRSEMLDLLRDKLSVRIEEKPRSYAEGRHVVVRITWDNEVVSEDSFDLRD